MLMVDGPDDETGDAGAEGPPAAEPDLPPEAPDDPPPEPFPGMEVAWSKTEQYTKWQADRFTSFDQKAGFVIGAAGVLVGLIRTVDHPNWIEALGQTAAGVAALLAVLSLRHRAGEIPGGEDLLVCATLEPKVAIGILMNTELAYHQQNEEPMVKKRKLLAGAAWALLAAVALTASGTWYRTVIPGNSSTPSGVTVTVKPAPEATEGPAGEANRPDPAASVNVNVTINEHPDPAPTKRDP